jgi:hypothetical protein
MGRRRGSGDRAAQLQIQATSGRASAGGASIGSFPPQEQRQHLIPYTLLTDRHRQAEIVPRPSAPLAPRPARPEAVE